MSETADALLESCKEMREALRIAMLVLISENADERFLRRCKEVCIEDGVGVRAGTAIERYEKSKLGILSI